MLRIGLTGGIGSGKSTVARLFGTLGVPVYDTDSVAKRLMDTDEELQCKIAVLFGERAYACGCLDRAYLASRAFTDRSLLRQLNAIVHPAVIDDFEEWSETMESEGHAYVVLESAILFESGFDEWMDYSVTVNAPVDLRIRRIVERDCSDPDKVRARIANQMDDAERELRADYVINNDEGDMLMPQVLELDKIFRK